MLIRVHRNVSCPCTYATLQTAPRDHGNTQAALGVSELTTTLVFQQQCATQGVHHLPAVCQVLSAPGFKAQIQVCSKDNCATCWCSCCPWLLLQSCSWKPVLTTLPVEFYMKLALGHQQRFFQVTQRLSNHNLLESVPNNKVRMV